MTQPDTTTTHHPPEEADSLAERRAKLLQLAEAQGVKPITSIDELRGDFWGDDDDPDEFTTWLRRTRASGTYRRLPE